jgi:hypothetical protein
MPSSMLIELRSLNIKGRVSIPLFCEKESIAKTS